MKRVFFCAVAFLIFDMFLNFCQAKTYVIDKNIDLMGDTLRIPEKYKVKFSEGCVISNGVLLLHNNKIEGARLCNITILGDIAKIDGCWFAECGNIDTNNFQFFLNSVSQTKSKGFFSKGVSVELSNNAIIKNNTFIDFDRCTLYKAGGSIINEGFLDESYDTENIYFKNLTIKNRGRHRTTAIIMIGVKNLKIKKIRFYDDSEADEKDGLGNWCMRLQGINILLDKITIDNYKSGIWADGIHAERVENFKLTNFHIQSGDDCIAIHNNMNDSKHNITFDEKGYCGYIPRRTRNVVVKNGVLCSYMARVLFIGAEEYVDSGFNIEDVSITNIRTLSGEKGQGIHIIDLRKSSSYPIRNIEFKNITLAFNVCSIVVGIDGHNPMGVENIKYYKVKGLNTYPYQNAQINHGILVNYARSVSFEKCAFESANKHPMSILNSRGIIFKDTDIRLSDDVESSQIFNSTDVFFLGGSLKSNKPIQLSGGAIVHNKKNKLSASFDVSPNSELLYE